MKYKDKVIKLKGKEKGKRKLKNKVKELRYRVKIGELTSKKAKKYIAGHLGYIQIANTKSLEEKLFES